MANTGTDGPSGHTLSDALKARLMDVLIANERCRDQGSAIVDAFRQIEQEIAAAKQHSWHEGWRGGELAAKRAAGGAQ